MADNLTENPGASGTAQPTLPVRDMDIPARDLDPDYQGGSAGKLPVDTSHSYTAGSDAGAAKGELAGKANEIGDEAKAGAADLTNKAKDAGNRVADQAREAYGEVKQFTDDAMGKARQQWDQTSGKATERAKQFAEGQKGRLAGGLDDAALAARKVVESLHERDDHGVAGYAESIAGGLENARDYLHRADVNEMLDGAKRFTRRHPEWVVGGLFVAGLAAARFLKSDKPGSSASSTSSRFTGGGTTPRRRDTHPGDDSLFDDLENAQHGDYPRAFDEISREGGESNPTTTTSAAGAGGPVSLDNPAGHTQPGPATPATGGVL